MPLKMKKALVTGGSSGIGAAIAAALVAEGVAVTVVARKQGVTPAGVEFISCDLTDAEVVKQLCETVAQGNFDLLVNAAGASQPRGFVATDDEAWEKNQRLLLEAPRKLMAAVIPAMREAGSGAIVNITSMAVEFPLPYMAPYNTHKAALAALTESLREELGPKIKFLEVRPGDIASDFGKDWKVQAGTPWEAASRHQQKLMAEAPSPKIVADAVMKALRKERQGVIRVGDFFQTVLAPIGIRLLPREWIRTLRIKYLNG